ncbi:MAG: tRNA (N6-isopentenyl adenosine(37)-C2)-methylthiotransferase MiaB, partial [Eubacteriales bacterium]|nr:tRNA (N6-isopentenyl adenosine(37)-C2)-methylthiotransferase MiaB [Eubacteriales bacterium]
SERIKGMLADMGFAFCDKPDNADFILYNTCAVRENAELRVFGNLGALKNIKRKRPEVIIAVCGCMMQQEHIAARIKSKYKHVDLVFGTHALYRFPQLLSEVITGTRVFDIKNEDGSVCEGISYSRDPIPLAKVPIMYGCNNFCTYCIVPYVRGRERSRNAKNIIDEVRRVASEGYKEVMLLGQNVNSYGNDTDGEITFAQLLKEVCTVDGIERVRFMTSHPKDISDELIEVMASEDKICKQLHLPIQCGSDRVLKLMNRKYTKEKYLQTVKKVRDAMPNIVLTTDIIVGFPGETNEDFEETLNVLKEVEYDTIFSFIYSKRVGTPAAEMPDVLTDEEKHKNFDRMLAVQNEISKRKNDAYLNTVQKVLVESHSKTNDSTMTGRTDGGKVVNFVGGDELIGEMVDVKITSAQTWSLFGEII